MSKYTKDDILFYMMEKHWKPDFYHLVGLCALYGGGITVAAVFGSDILGLVVTIGIGGPLMIYTSRTALSAIKKDDMQCAARELASKKVPWRFLFMTYQAGYGPMDALQCYESHIPGDCPLCGAE